MMTRKKSDWTSEQIKELNKYTIKDIFHPIPHDFVEDSIRGYSHNGHCITRPCKMIMFNFDHKDGCKQALRGIVGVDFKVAKNNQTYIFIRIIGCKSITNTPAALAKSRSDTIMKTGRDMIVWWKQFAIRGKFNYIKLNGMEDVLGFYWKYGWRFLHHPTAKHALDEATWKSRLDKLNYINRLKTTDSCWVEKERSKILDKYFDRFLEGYYSDIQLRAYRNKDDIYDIYDIDGTRRRHHLALRYHGYAMFWFPINEKIEENNVMIAV